MGCWSSAGGAVDFVSGRLSGAGARTALLFELRAEIVVEPRAPRCLIPGIVTVLLALARLYKVHMVTPVCRVHVMQPSKTKRTEY
jgi:hypothetical protein